MAIFINWYGGEQPVPNLSHVLVKFRNSEFNTDENYYAQELDWTHDPDAADTDIIAYSPAAIQPVFTIWTGGENPVPGAYVEIVQRYDQTIVFEHESETFDWSHDANDPDSDIILYRVVEGI